MAGAPPQTPNTGQSRVIVWRSGYGVEPHLQITFVFFVAQNNSCFSVPLWLCVKLYPASRQMFAQPEPSSAVQ